MNKLLQRFVMLAVFWVMGMGFVEAQRTVTGTVTDQALSLIHISEPTRPY